jgi:A/G-specific adenine glycosylase
MRSIAQTLASPGVTYSEQVETRDPEMKQASLMRRQMLDWYDRHRRDLPWRKTSDPYSIWISEIMLQQTRVAVVIDRYGGFLERFPTVNALAKAREEEVLAIWSGLGYYRRARMLHKAAQQVASQYSGKLPQTAGGLRSLPGIGTYTAAAIASIAHGERVAVVDGNVERVLCRIAGWNGSGKANTALRKQVEALAVQLVDPARPGDFNQAMMELGATVCTPRNPQCLACPLNTHCKTRGEHKTALRKPMRTVEIGHALALRAKRGKTGVRQEVLLELRPGHLTVMPGLWELPALRNSAVPEPELRMTVRHAIMQVNYTVRIRSVSEKDLDLLAHGTGERKWVAFENAGSIPLTGLARKVLTRARLLADKIG